MADYKEFDYLIGGVYDGEMVRIREFGTMMGSRMWKASVFSPKRRVWVDICSTSANNLPGSEVEVRNARRAYAEEVAADMPRLRRQYPWMY